MVTESKRTVYTTTDGKLFFDRDEANEHEATSVVTALVENVFRWNRGGETDTATFVQDLLDNRAKIIVALGGHLPAHRFEKVRS